MSLTREAVLQELKKISLPEGGDLVSRNLVKGLGVEGGLVAFVIEVDPNQGAAMEPVRLAAQKLVEAMPGVEKVNTILTAHTAEANPASPPPQLKVGGHPTPQSGPKKVEGVKHVVLIASGKGGVGKSTVSSNLAVALSREGLKVGLLDADMLGPSQHRMMGLTNEPGSDGKKIEPLENYGVKFMSMGLMVKAEEAVVWRGPMLMGALQQFLGDVSWGELDVLVIDLPPGTGDVQLSLAQNTVVTGAVIVSTPQDVALLDARKAISMCRKTRTPILGMIENMSTHVCSNCGHEEHIFGHGGAKSDADAMGIQYFGDIPLDINIRLASDGGKPIATEDGPLAQAYRDIAKRLIETALT